MSQYNAQIPPPAVGTPFESSLSGTFDVAPNTTQAPPLSSTQRATPVTAFPGAHGTSAGPPVHSSNNPLSSAGPQSVQSTGQPGGVLDSAKSASAYAQQTASQVATSAQQTASSAVSSAQETAARARETVGNAASTVKSKLPDDPKDALPASHGRPEGVATPGVDPVTNILSAVGGLIINAPAAALEVAANKAGQPQVAEQIKAGAARASAMVGAAGKGAYEQAPSAEQVKGAAGSAYSTAYNAAPSTQQIKSAAATTHGAIVNNTPSAVVGVRSTAGNAASTVGNSAVSAAQYVAQSLPASIQAQLPTSLANPATSPSATTGAATHSSLSGSSGASHTTTGVPAVQPVVAKPIAVQPTAGAGLGSARTGGLEPVRASGLDLEPTIGNRV